MIAAISNYTYSVLTYAELIAIWRIRCVLLISKIYNRVRSIRVRSMVFRPQEYVVYGPNKTQFWRYYVRDFNDFPVKPQAPSNSYPMLNGPAISAHYGSLNRRPSASRSIY